MTADRAREMLWEAMTREIATWPRGFDPETDTKPERPQDWAAYRGDWVANAAADALTKALQSADEVRKRLQEDLEKAIAYNLPSMLVFTTDIEALLSRPCSGVVSADPELCSSGERTVSARADHAAGSRSSEGSGTFTLSREEKVRAEEKERCAQVADAHAEIWEAAAATIAAAIRSAPSRSGGGEGHG